MTQHLTEDEQLLVNRIRRQPELIPVLEEILDLAGTSALDGVSLDEAEDQTWEVISKTGREMLKGWCQRKAERETQKTIDEGVSRPHEKKMS